jgi:hypothetical protein
MMRPGILEKLAERAPRLWSRLGDIAAALACGLAFLVASAAVGMIGGLTARWVS